MNHGKSRLELVKQGLVSGLSRRGRLIVSIDRLVEDTNNERKTFRNMEGLVASIKAVGLVEPITVTPEGERFRILTGHRRARAAKLANLREVEVLIREDDNELLRRRKSLISNVQREDLGAIELAEALQAMLDEDNEIQSQVELARVLGKRANWVSDMLSMLNLPTEIQEKLRRSDVALPYDTVIRIARVSDPKAQLELLNMALSGTSNTELRRKVSELSKGANKQYHKTKRTERLSVEVAGYTAQVHGPAGKGARENMLAAVEQLRERLESGELADAA